MINTEQAYQDYRDSIRQAVWAAVRPVNGDREEMEAIANLALVQACQSYQEGKGACLHTWIRTQVASALATYARIERKHQMQSIPAELPDTHEPDPLAFIGHFARQVVDVALSLHTEQRGRPARASTVRRVLREAGWTVREIVRAFAEIREALCG